jgi:hypothetical protein
MNKRRLLSEKEEDMSNPFVDADADEGYKNIYDTPLDEGRPDIPRGDDAVVGLIDMWGRASANDLVETFDEKQKEKIVDFLFRHAAIPDGQDKEILGFLNHIDLLVRRTGRSRNGGI